jgi:hypothetical protein
MNDVDADNEYEGLWGLFHSSQTIFHEFLHAKYKLSLFQIKLQHKKMGWKPGDGFVEEGSKLHNHLLEVKEIYQSRIDK